MTKQKRMLRRLFCVVLALALLPATTLGLMVGFALMMVLDTALG